MFNPDRVREEVRLSTYANTQEEKEAVFAIDQAVFEPAREHEKGLAAVAEAMVTENGAIVRSATDAVVELRELRRGIQSGDIPPTRETARRLAALRGEVTGLSETVDMSLRAADSQIRKAEDPWTSYKELINRFPPLEGHVRSRLFSTGESRTQS